MPVVVLMVPGLDQQLFQKQQVCVNFCARTCTVSTAVPFASGDRCQLSQRVLATVDVVIACTAIVMHRTCSLPFHAGQKLLPEMTNCLGRPVPVKSKHFSVHPGMAHTVYMASWLWPHCQHVPPCIRDCVTHISSFVYPCCFHSSLLPHAPSPFICPVHCMPMHPAFLYGSLSTG